MGYFGLLEVISDGATSSFCVSTRLCYHFQFRCWVTEVCGACAGFGLFERSEMCVYVCVLSFGGENMSIKPVLSKSQFNKCVVFRQTWSQPQTSHAPTLNPWKNHRAGDTYTATYHFNYSYLTQMHTSHSIDSFVSERPFAIRKNMCFLLVLLFLFIFGFVWLFASLIKLKKSVNSDDYYSSEYASADIISVTTCCSHVLQCYDYSMNLFPGESDIVLCFLSSLSLSLLSHWNTLFQSVLWNR